MKSSTAVQAGIPDDDVYISPRFTMVTAAGQRLHWTLNGSLQEAIKVAPREYYEPGDIFEPYFQPVNPEGAPAAQTPSLHPVSQQPIFELKNGRTQEILEERVTTHTVMIDVLKQWAVDWDDMHYKHADPDDPRHWCREYDYGPLEDGGGAPLVWCCGEDRPLWKDAKVEVTAAGEFLTVHEYILAVHPWLMSMRERIRDAYRKKYEWRGPLRDDEELVVTMLTSPLKLGLEKRWAALRKKPVEWDPQAPVYSTGSPEVEAVHRKVLERRMARTIELLGMEKATDLGYLPV